MIRRLALLASSTALLLVACADPYLPSEVLGRNDEPFSSNQATLLDFEFEGEFTTRDSWDLERVIDDQLLYTIGHLNHDNSVGRLDKVQITNIRPTGQADGTTKVVYHAKLPVAWGSKTNLPTTYRFTLPKQMDYAGLNAFTEKYKTSCVDHGAHDVDSGSMWYYYRPAQSGCAISADDSVVFQAAASVSAENTTSKYPEYNKVWEDDALDVVAIFGKYEDGATTASDAGIAAYNRFVSSSKQTLGSSVATTPAAVPANPGVAMPDVSMKATLSGNRRVTITALLVDNVRTADAAFNTRYGQLSGTADIIIYNGHAGLGDNVRALVQKGTFFTGKYQIFFMNGCDTYAYVDGFLAQKKAQLNPDDPNGTKYLDMVTNAMPSFFSSMPYASMAMIQGLLAKDAPKTYDQIFTDIDDSEVVVVTGEEDNAYVPGGGSGTGWAGMNETGSVVKDEQKNFTTPTLQPGVYVITMKGSATVPGGDADLYVRAGSAPTTTTYDCRPYKSGSDEECQITLTSAKKIYITVRGYASAGSPFTLTGRQQQTGGGSGWSGMTQTGNVTKDQEVRFETPTLAAGSYRFSIAHSASNAGGDADLYVKAGAAPTTSVYDCRPYQGGSAETCSVTLTAPSVVHVLVRGYAAQASHFVLTGASN